MGSKSRTGTRQPAAPVAGSRVSLRLTPPGAADVRCGAGSVLPCLQLLISSSSLRSASPPTPSFVLLTLNVPLKSNPALDALLDRLARLAEDALRGLAAGRNVLGKRVRRYDEGDDALVIGRRVDGELGLATAALGSMSSVWLRSAFQFLSRAARGFICTARAA